MAALTVDDPGAQEPQEEQAAQQPGGEQADDAEPEIADDPFIKVT